MALFFVSSLMYSREAFLLIYYLSAMFCFLLKVNVTEMGCICLIWKPTLTPGPPPIFKVLMISSCNSKGHLEVPFSVRLPFQIITLLNSHCAVMNFLPSHSPSHHALWGHSHFTHKSLPQSLSWLPLICSNLRYFSSSPTFMASCRLSQTLMFINWLCCLWIDPSFLARQFHSRFS